MQATPLPAFGESYEMENREQQNRFLQHIQDSDRQGDNPRVFLKAGWFRPPAKNPDRDASNLHHQTQNLVQQILRNNLGWERKII